MTWCGALVIMYLTFKEDTQGTYPVWENVILVQADTEAAASAKAEKYARDAEGDQDGTLRWEQRPSTMVFAGIPATGRASLNGRAARSDDGKPERGFSGLRSGFRGESTARLARRH
jgi:Domain of unknown function (DUF4288)